MLITLQRRAEQPHSTPGQLAVNGAAECFTLEPPSANVPFPRIAAGTFPVTLRPSFKFQQLALQDSWFKQYCDAMPHIEYKPDSVTMIHPGNTPDQTHDCVIVGQTRAFDYVGNSRASFAELYAKIAAAVKAEGCQIEIVDCQNDAAQVRDLSNGEN